MQNPLSAISAQTGLPMQPAVLLGFCIFVFSLLFGAYWLSALGLGAASYYFARLLIETGRDLPIESLILAISSLQWIVGPVLAYWGLSNSDKYIMYVPEDEYMALAVPGVILLSVGLYSLRFKYRLEYMRASAQATTGLLARSRNFPIYLIGIGILSSFLTDRVPEWLAFPVYILSNIKYIGLIYLIFSRQFGRMVPLVIAFSLTFLSSLQNAMFHDFLLWMAFVGMYVAYIIKPSMGQKVVVVLLMLSFIGVIQVIKSNYREQLAEEGSGDIFGKLSTAVDQQLFEDGSSSADNVSNLVNRVNQGWIISRIMQNVPSLIPYADGDTIITAIKASILPRLLYPDKPIAGGQANYERYTGFPLTDETSMGISLLGEAYINFGLEGAWAFMLAFGLMTGWVIRRFLRLASNYATIWLWLPLVLLHFVKAETELLVQLNFVTKSIFLALFFLWFNKKFLKWRL